MCVCVINGDRQSPLSGAVWHTADQLIEKPTARTAGDIFKACINHCRGKTLGLL